MALQPEVVAGVEAAAEALVREWLKEQHSPISKLSDVRRAQYEPIRREARDSEETKLSPPQNDLVRDSDQRWAKHLLSTTDGDYPLDLRGWERAVVEIELQSEDLQGWYRNPVGTDAALRIPYPGEHHDKAMYPDFVFFHQTTDGIKPSILDPHAYSYQDAAAKLKGLARYAEEHGDKFWRIESIIEDPDGRLIALDMKSATVRAAVEAISGENVYGTYVKHGGAIT